MRVDSLLVLIYRQTYWVIRSISTLFQTRLLWNRINKYYYFTQLFVHGVVLKCNMLYCILIHQLNFKDRSLCLYAFRPFENVQ